MRLQALARRIGGEASTTANPDLVRLASLHEAGADDLSFLPHPRLKKHIRFCRAGAVIVGPADLALCQRPAIVVAVPLLAAARAAALLPLATRANRVRARPLQCHECVDSKAFVHPSAQLGHGVTVAAGATVGPGCVIGDGVRIGAYTTLGPNVTIEAAATVGNRVTIKAGAHVGGEAFLYVRDGARWLRLPCFGSVEIGDDADVGSHAAIDRGALAHTVIRAGAKLDNHVHIGHGVVVGSDVAIAAHTVVAGETIIGDGCVIGGAAAIGEGLTIAPRVTITATSMVTKDITEPGARYSSGWPAEPSTRWWRRVAGFRKRATGLGL